MLNTIIKALAVIFLMQLIILHSLDIADAYKYHTMYYEEELLNLQDLDIKENY